MPPPTQRAHCSIKVQFEGTGKAQQFEVWCVCVHLTIVTDLWSLWSFSGAGPLFSSSAFFFFCYEAVTQHALQKVLSKRLGAGAEFVKKAELSGQTDVTHSHQTRTVQQDQIAKSPHAQKGPYPSPNAKIPAGEEPSLSLWAQVSRRHFISSFLFVQCCSKSHFCTPPILGIFPQRGRGRLRKQQNLWARTTNCGSKDKLSTPSPRRDYASRKGKGPSAFSHC